MMQFGMTRLNHCYMNKGETDKDEMRERWFCPIHEYGKFEYAPSPFGPNDAQPFCSACDLSTLVWGTPAHIKL